MSNVSVRYIVPDVEAAISFYTEHFDFEEKMHPAPGFAMLVKDNLRLLLNAPGQGGAGQPAVDGSSPEPGGWNRFQLHVRDVSAKADQLRAAGVMLCTEVIEGKGGKQVLALDPAGNMVELFEPNKPEAVPAGFHAVTPFLAVREAGELADFIVKAFDGVERYRMTSDDGVVRHAVVAVGSSPIMISSATDHYGKSRGAVHLYVEDVDATYEQAMGLEGVSSLREPSDQFYGDRSAGVQDRWENQWWLATHVEDVDEAELKSREARFRAEQ